ncbi:MAG: phosphoribosylanthranilate isomerase [Fulvimarina manganoxydans]|uniref:phosphoribosylanthranilate isomerase n=1 Tax=Fulvimarina manganoxydans TaxID=937218 RepID=UPI00235245FF|nr:phosphoribosylanthranilate isomerase [Fulvimarina manganoxydans]MCK5931166.1 phosphoribosylanthranilate isomerase [Fulvimarina manganoxydans]
MTLDVKICGLKSREALDAAILRGASHVGFVHFERSPRHLALGAMAELAEIARGRAQIVIVTVDPGDDLVDKIRREVRPDWLQLHGKESLERVAAIKGRSGLKVMKALTVSTYDDLLPVDAYRPAADALLLDSKRPKGSVLPGGNGLTFDWQILAALDPAIGFMLSGGLNAENVSDALRIARPAGLDVSSGVESAPGVKDIGRIHAFFDALERSLERAA